MAAGDSDLLLTKTEAAALLGKSERTVDRLRAAGALSPQTVHGRLLFPAVEVVSVAAARRATSGGQ